MSSNPPLPTGTVTFLFTDIQGSTSLYENYPVQMQAALERHDEILRSCIEEHEGYVFKTVGDAFCAAFATTRAALQATLTSQRALFAETWPEDIQQLRVRIALHTGVADERDGDYFGPPVNRVARLLSAGHGGQILLSDAAYNLARDYLVHLEPEGKLRDLGEHRLKDLIYTEHIYQLIVPDLPKDFPPLRTHGVVTAPELSNLERRYHRIRHISSGGMGEVYLVHHEALDRDMALKILKNPRMCGSTRPSASTNGATTSQ
jgi:class 3 adenylate cyclase